jgi:hypothetical protein
VNELRLNWLYPDFAKVQFVLNSSDKDYSIHLHTRVSFCATTTVAQALSSWGHCIGGCGVADLKRLFPSLPVLTPETSVDVLALLELDPISPPLPLKSLGIQMPAATICQQCDEYEVLAVLKALPVEARTPWTMRVVQRNNDIRG